MTNLRRAEQQNGYSVRRQGGSGGYCAVIFCDYCSAEDQLSLSARLPPEVVRQKFIDKGWQIPRRSGKAACPRCLATFKSIAREKGVAKSANVRVVAASPTAAQQRKLYALLEQHFNDETGSYAADWDDARLAEEIGISEASVRGIRESSFGALAPPMALQTLQGELVSLKSMLCDVELRLQAELKKYK